MAFDPFQISSARRLQALRVGEQFPSEQTVRQAELTLAAIERYGSELSDFGYNGDDAEELKACLDALLAARASRDEVRTPNKQPTAELQQALSVGKTARQRAQAVLDRAAQLSLEDKPLLAGAINGVLSQTRSAKSDPQALRHQLSVLLEKFGDQEVAAVVHSRGGPSAVRALAQAIKDLDGARTARLPTVSYDESETIDFLDGLIVENARDARRAARIAAQILGRPELAAAFELTALQEGKDQKRHRLPGIDV
jgi:hypothetical protein